MTRTFGIVSTAIVVGLGGSATAMAQPAERLTPSAVTRPAAPNGAIQGTIVDDRGAPVSGAVVSVVGSATAFTVSDHAGRFILPTLPVGAYVLTAHLQGFAPARSRMVEVRATRVCAGLRIQLRRASGVASDPPVLEAGIGGAAVMTTPAAGTEPDTGTTEDDDHSETAWRLRHARRSVLNEAAVAAAIQSEEDSALAESLDALRRAIGSPVRLATSLFAPLSGQLNLLTTTSFDQTQDLFSGSAPQGVAYLRLGAAAGAVGDWSMRAALTQGDLTSWIVAGTYVTRAPATHQYSFGMSHALQRYQGGNAAALLAVADGSRNIGAVDARDRWTIRPGLILGYGAAYARYDYLRNGLFSPRLDITVAPARGLTVRAAVTRRMLAPGSEEFLPPSDASVWLPPQRTFAPISHGVFQPERTDQVEVGFEQALGGDTVLGARVFRQQVTDQIVTLFGSQMPDVPPVNTGHYWVATGGNVDARGWTMSLSRSMTRRVRGSIDYTFASAQWVRAGDSLLAVVAPSAMRGRLERLHDLTTSVAVSMPYTATRVFVLYRINNAFAGGRDDLRFDRRFDVQVNQSLPFLNFTAAQWEMLLSLRNAFYDDRTDGSLYDELLVIHPPKRVIGGLTVRF